MSAALRLLVYSDATEVGGAEISLRTLVGALAAGIDVDVVGHDPAVVDLVADARAGSRAHLLPAPANVRDVASLRALRTAIVDCGPDVFHANLNAPWSCRYGILVARSVRGIRRVAVEQLVLPLRTVRTRIVKRVTSAWLDAHVAVGDESARSLERDAGLRAGSVRTIRNAVDDVVLAARARPADAPTLVTLARLDPVKGLDVLVDALVALDGVHAVVVGEGAERDALEARARARGVADRFHLVGWDPDARSWLGAADLMVLPSRAEGLPLSIAEAMLAARPVVACDVGSVREIVADGVTGLLVPADDVAALAGAVAALLRDPARRAAMGAAGRARALEEFTAGRMARQFEALYSELTGGPSTTERAA